MRHVITYAKKKIKKFFHINNNLKNIIKRIWINIDEFEINTKITQEKDPSAIN